MWVSGFDRPAASAGGSSIGVVVVCWFWFVFVFFVPSRSEGGLCQSADQLD